MQFQELPGVADWAKVQERYEAWWEGELVDRVVISVRAPRQRLPAEPVPPERLRHYWTDPDYIIARQERRIAATYYAGDAFPVLSPVQGTIPSILAAFLGAPAQFVDTSTVWLGPTIESWEGRTPLCFTADGEWWHTARRLLQAGAERAPGRYYIMMPDLNNPFEALARLRGAQTIALDLIEHPDEVLRAMGELNYAWFRYWQACHGLVQQHVDGYLALVPVWSKLPNTDLQCDFSVMISRSMFDTFLLPFIEEQTRWVGRSIFHVDGEGVLRHLDSILDIPGVSAIQWQPGHAGRPMARWIPLLRHIQARGKRIWIDCEPQELDPLLAELDPRGLCLSVGCASPDEADAVVAAANRLTARHTWLVPRP